MTTQTEKKEIYKALVLTINDLQNPSNSVDNKFYKSKYVPLADIIDIAKPIMKKHGLTFFQTPFVMYELIQQVAKDGNVYNAEVAVIKLTTTFIHESGEVLNFPPMVMKAQGNTPQNIGSTITYARRYTLTSLLGMAGKEDDDDGNMAGMQPNNYQGQEQYNNYPGQSQSNQYNQPNNSNQNQQMQQNNMQNNNQNNQQANTGNQQQAESNVDLSNVVATVTNKTEGKSGKGTPYIEMTLEKDGQFVTAMAKDDGVYQIAKGLEKGSTATFKLISANGIHFISAIIVQEANA